MSDNPNKPTHGNEADESQEADTRLLFARILERLDRIEKKLDSQGNSNRAPRPWSGGGQDNRRPGGFNRPFKPNGFAPRPGGFAPRPGGPARFDGARGPARFDGPRGPRPHQGHGKPFGNRPPSPR